MTKDQIAAELTSEDINITGILERTAEDNSGYFVYITINRSPDGTQTPSSNKIKKLKEKFDSLGITLDFIISDETAENIEAGLRAKLYVTHPNLIINSFLSLDSRSAHVWIEPKPDTQDSFQKIEATTRNYLLNFKLDPITIAFTANVDIPTSLAILRALRIISPASLHDLSTRLSKNFTVPSEDWLKRKLEGLRKKEFVVWLKGQPPQKPHSYALTLKALKTLGSERNASSPDITRFLAIAKSPK